MLSGPAGLVVIQHHRPFTVPRGPVDPHIAFLCGFPAIFPQHGQRGLVRVEYLVREQFTAQTLEEILKPSLVGGDHPVCHCLPGRRHTDPLKFLFLPVQRQCQRIFVVQNVRKQAGRNNPAAGDEPRWDFALFHGRG